MIRFLHRFVTTAIKVHELLQSWHPCWINIIVSTSRFTHNKCIDLLHKQILVRVFSVQVSKTDPSPKREMPTMILFNVVFALRVCQNSLNLELKHIIVLCGKWHNKVSCLWVGCVALSELKAHICGCVCVWERDNTAMRSIWGYAEARRKAGSLIIIILVGRAMPMLSHGYQEVS